MARKCAKYGIVVLFSILAMTAVVFSILAVTSCEFIQYTDQDGTTRGAGLYKFQLSAGEEGIPDQCVTYSEIEASSLSAAERTAMICGFLAPCFGILALALASIELYLCDRCCIGCLVSVLFMFGTLAQSLTFLFLQSSSFCSLPGTDGCSLGIGAIYSIVAVSVLFVAGCTLGAIPKTAPLFMSEKDDDAYS